MATINRFACMYFLDGLVAKVGRITLALKSIADPILFCQNINTLISACLGNGNTGKTAFTQQSSTPRFECGTVHKIDS